MTLPASGVITLAQVNTELGRSATASINMNESAVRTLFGKPSGAISMSDGWGKSSGPAFGWNPIPIGPGSINDSNGDAEVTFYVNLNGTVSMQVSSGSPNLPFAGNYFTPTGNSTPNLVAARAVGDTGEGIYDTGYANVAGNLARGGASAFNYSRTSYYCTLYIRRNSDNAIILYDFNGDIGDW